eukprot:gb/GFBE01056409.1/.p1 GENE.gb/GFBE01056409.1/~~gb/GFBE01056409.1/.p1  ORF type:complete len:409 (+),score=91.08 gb/GFBE01056409.1/:1-1227(+)
MSDTMEPPSKRQRQETAISGKEGCIELERCCDGKIPDITGLWAVQDPNDRYHLYRWRQAIQGGTFEGVDLGFGAISKGQLLPGGGVEWSIDGKRWRGQLDPTGWCIRDGTYHCEESGAALGTFAAMRQREVSADEEEKEDDWCEDRHGKEYTDWADGLFFSLDRDGREQLLDADGIQVMMEWEKPYMERCADELNVTPECDVLEVGFGCGYSASRLQEKKPRSHTIIECSEVVLERLRAWAADKPNVRVVEGTWQHRLPELGVFDRIFFDDYGQPGQSDREMFVNCPNEGYKEVYDQSQSHFHAFVNIALKWHAREGSRISGYLVHPIDIRRNDVEVSFEPYSVAPPAHCDYFFSDTAFVPIFSKTAATAVDGASDSTRSRSPSLSGSSVCSAGAEVRPTATRTDDAV